MMQPASPARESRATSSRLVTPPEAMTATPGTARASSAVASTLGPSSMPSLLMSV